VPLSEEELRLLEQMERALVAEDPKLASTMRGATLRATARRRALIAAFVFVLGIAVLMTGAVTQLIPVGIIGFVVMLASAYVALSSWRGQDKTPERNGQSETGPHATFSVIEGGRSRKRTKGGSKGTPKGPRRSSSHGSMMERFEERWRRRRDQNGY
jgi:Protein of unknown function (DUF3040)